MRGSAKRSHCQAENDRRPKTLRKRLKKWARIMTTDTTLLRELDRDIAEAGLAKLCGLEAALRPFVEAKVGGKA